MNNLQLLLDNKIIESGERFYRYNTKLNRVEYSDDLHKWKLSSISINQLLDTKFNVASFKITY